MNRALQVARFVGRALWAIVRFVYAVIYVLTNAVYKLVTRTALYTLTLYLVIYFAINSTGFRRELMAFLSRTLPGDLDCTTIQWGPLPWSVTILDADIRDPRGRPVIRVGRTTTALDLLALWGYAVRRTTVGSEPFHLRFTEADIEGADVLVEVGMNGFVGIGEAFSDPREADGPPGPGTRIQIEGVSVKDSRIRVDVPGVIVDGVGLDVAARVTIDDGKVRVQGPRVLSRKGTVSIAGAGPGRSTLSLPWTGLDVHDAVWNHGLLLIGYGDLHLSRTPVTLHGSLDTRGDVDFDASVVLDAPSDEPLLVAFQDRHLSGGVKAKATLKGTLAELSLSADLSSPDLVVPPLALGPIALHVEMHLEEVYRGVQGHRIQVAPFSVGVLDGAVHVDELLFWPAGTESRRETALAHVSFEGVDPAELWTLGLFGAGSTPPDVITGRARGDLHVTARRAIGDFGQPVYEAAGDLDVAMEWAGDRAVPLAERYGARGDFLAYIGDGEATIETPGLYAYSGKDEVTLAGSVDLFKRKLDVGLTALIDVGNLLQSLGVPKIGGVVQLTNARVSGPLLNPNLDARLKTVKGYARDVAFERLTGAVSLQDGTLRVRSLNARSNWGTLKGHVQLDLWSRELSRLSRKMPLVVRDVVVTGFDLGKLALREVAGKVDVKAPQVSAELRTPGLAIVAEGDVSAKDLRVMGQAFRSLTGHVALAGDDLAVTSLDVDADTRGRLRGEASWSRKTGKVQAELTVDGFDLAQVSSLAGASLPLTGTLERLTVRGALRLHDFKPRDLQLQLDATLERVAWGDDLVLGDGRVKVDLPRGASQATLSSPSFFAGLGLEAGVLHLDGHGLPDAVALALSITKVDVAAVLPGLRKSLPKLTVAGGLLRLDVPFRGGEPMRLRADLPDRAIALPTGKKSPLLRNEGELWATLVGDTITVERAIVSYGEHRVALCGSIDLSSLAMDVHVAGSLDITRFPQLKSTFSDVQGRITTHRREATADSPLQGSCLLAVSDASEALGQPSGWLEVSGTPKAPVVTGAFRFDDVRLLPRGFPYDIVLKTGVADLERDGKKQLLVIHPSDAVQASVGDGKLTVSGSAVAPDFGSGRWMPPSVTLDVSGDDLELFEPKAYQVTVSPKLMFTMESEGDAAPALALRGEVDIADGQYFFDKFGQTLGNFFNRSEQGGSTPLTEKLPVLKDLALEVRVKSPSFQVKTELAVASADLESRFDLRLGGTLGDPTVRGRVEVTEGTVVYKLYGRREFDIQHGFLDFDGEPSHPRIDVEAVANIEPPPSESGSQRLEDEVYQVVIKITGRMPDIEPHFESRPAFSQTDIQYLILTGRKKSDFERPGADNSATLGLLEADLTKMLTNVLSMPFLQEATLTSTTKGDPKVELAWKLGNLKLRVQGQRESGTTTYGSTFTFKISDHLVLEGVLKSRTEDSDTQRYETRFRYSIPLD